MFGRSDWSEDGSYDYSDQAMDMMSMRYVMTDGAWEDDDDDEPSCEHDRYESDDWDDNNYDDNADDDWDDRVTRRIEKSIHLEAKSYVRFPRSERTPHMSYKQCTCHVTGYWIRGAQAVWERVLGLDAGE